MGKRLAQAICTPTVKELYKRMAELQAVCPHPDGGQWIEGGQGAGGCFRPYCDAEIR